MAKVSKISAMLRAHSVSPACKSEVPTESVDKSVQKLADQVVDAKRALIDAEGRYSILEKEIVEKSDRIYANRAEAGHFAKSMNIDGIETTGVQIVYTDKFTGIDTQVNGKDNPQEKNLRKILGKRFDSLFEERRTVSMVKADDKTIDLLVEKLGEDVFLDIFQIRVQIVPSKGFDEAQFELPAQVREIVKQAKPSVRLRKENGKGGEE